MKISLNQQRRIIVTLYIPNVEVMKTFYDSNSWWCSLLQGNRKYYMNLWRSQSTKKNYCYIVYVQFPNVEVMKSFYESNNWWCSLLEGNRKKILQRNNYTIMKKQGQNHTWKTMIFSGPGIRILLWKLPFASKLGYVSTINEYQGVIIRHWFILVLTFFFWIFQVCNVRLPQYSRTEIFPLSNMLVLTCICH